MEWLSQNWIWLAVGIGVVMMMRHGGAGGGCCGGHSAHDKHVEAGDPQAKKTGTGAGSCH